MCVPVLIALSVCLCLHHTRLLSELLHRAAASQGCSLCVSVRTCGGLQREHSSSMRIRQSSQGLAKAEWAAIQSRLDSGFNWELVTTSKLIHFQGKRAAQPFCDERSLHVALSSLLRRTRT